MGSGGAATEGEGKAEPATTTMPPQQLVGFKNFVRHNPRSGKFAVHRFHHVEFWVGDATNAYKRCVWKGWGCVCTTLNRALAQRTAPAQPNTTPASSTASA